MVSIQASARITVRTNIVTMLLAWNSHGTGHSLSKFALPIRMLLENPTDAVYESTLTGFFDCIFIQVHR